MKGGGDFGGLWANEIAARSRLRAGEGRGEKEPAIIARPDICEQWAKRELLAGDPGQLGIPPGQGQKFPETVLSRGYCAPYIGD